MKSTSFNSGMLQVLMSVWKTSLNSLAMHALPVAIRPGKDPMPARTSELDSFIHQAVRKLNSLPTLPLSCPKHHWTLTRFWLDSCCLFLSWPDTWCTLSMECMDEDSKLHVLFISGWDLWEVPSDWPSVPLDVTFISSQGYTVYDYVS